MESIERRDYNLEGLEVREAEGGAQTIRGLAVPFNRVSGDLGGFTESIDPRSILWRGESSSR